MGVFTRLPDVVSSRRAAFPNAAERMPDNIYWEFVIKSPVCHSERGTKFRTWESVSTLTKIINCVSERIATAVYALPRNDIQGEFCVDFSGGIGECRPTDYIVKLHYFLRAIDNRPYRGKG